MDSSEVPTPTYAEMKEKIDTGGTTKITPFSIADILTRGTNVDESQAIDMSSKCAACDRDGNFFYILPSYFQNGKI